MSEVFQENTARLNSSLRLRDRTMPGNLTYVKAIFAVQSYVRALIFKKTFSAYLKI